MKHQSKRLASLILSCLLAPMSWATVVEISKCSESLSTLSKVSMVVFDIDNTLIRPIQTLGSDQWYGSRVDFWKKSGISDGLAVDAAIKDWQPVQTKTDVQISEPTWASLIQSLKKRGIPVMALTSRPLSLIEATVKQLSSVGISFATGNPYPKDFESTEPFPARYTQGILFVGPKNDKGPQLQSFLKSIGQAPKRLAFLDDKRKHVDNLEKVFKESGIGYIGFRYGFLDSWVASFDPKLADEEFQIFKNSSRIPSDQEILKNFSPLSLSCRGMGDIKQLGIRSTGLQTYEVDYEYDLDVPGGAHGNVQLQATGDHDALAIHITAHSSSGEVLGKLTAVPEKDSWHLTGNLNSNPIDFQCTRADD